MSTRCQKDRLTDRQIERQKYFSAELSKKSCLECQQKIERQTDRQTERQIEDRKTFQLSYQNKCC